MLSSDRNGGSGSAELLTLQPMSPKEKSAAQLAPDNFHACTHLLQTSLTPDSKVAPQLASKAIEKTNQSECSSLETKRTRPAGVTHSREQAMLTKSQED